MTDNIYIFKSDVKDYDTLESLVGLHNCIIMLDDNVYVIEGTPEDIEAFRQDWKKYILKEIEKHKEKLYNV